MREDIGKKLTDLGCTIAKESINEAQKATSNTSMFGRIIKGTDWLGLGTAVGTAIAEKIIEKKKNSIPDIVPKYDDIKDRPYQWPNERS